MKITKEVRGASDCLKNESLTMAEAVAQIRASGELKETDAEIEAMLLADEAIEAGGFWFYSEGAARFCPVCANDMPQDAGCDEHGHCSNCCICDPVDGDDSADVYEMSAEEEKRREELARSAFWGGAPAVSDYILNVRGYEMDGSWHPANGATLAEYIETVMQMSASDFEGFASARYSRSREGWD